MEWDDDAIQKIRTLWAEGHSTAEIGRRMGVSKNAIVGKAHRLVLPPRPSPIRRDGAPRPQKRAPMPRVSGPTLPPMVNPVGNQVGNPSGNNEALARSLPPIAPPRVIEQNPAPRPALAALPEPKPVLRPVSLGVRSSSRLVGCCWPIGEPGTPDFHFCDGEALNGKPYCAAHAQVAYVKVRDRREEAA
jgi:GcrA cell cycle regulator